MKFFATHQELKTDVEYAGLTYARLLEYGFGALRTTLGVRKRIPSKFDLLMHATFELAFRENVSTRVYTQKEHVSKLRWGHDELKFVTGEIERKYDLIDTRPKTTHLDIMLKAVFMLNAKFSETFTKFDFIISKAKIVKSKLGKSKSKKVKIQTKSIKTKAIKCILVNVPNSKIRKCASPTGSEMSNDSEISENFDMEYTPYPVHDWTVNYSLFSL